MVCEGVLVPEDARTVVALLDEDVEGVVEADVVEQRVLVLGRRRGRLELGAHAAGALLIPGGGGGGGSMLLQFGTFKN